MSRIFTYERGFKGKWHIYELKKKNRRYQTSFNSVQAASAFCRKKNKEKVEKPVDKN